MLEIILFMFFFYFSLPELTWVIPDNPPFQILHGDYKEKGIGDRVQKFLITKLVGYRHETIESHFKRAMTLSKHRLVCVSQASMTQERMNFFIKSNDYLESDQLYLASHDKNAQKLKPFIQKDGQIDLVAASQRLELTIGKSGGKSYGPYINAIMDTFLKREFAYNRMAQFKMVDMMYKMFLSNRVDLFVDYRESLYYLLVLRNEKKIGIQYYPILGSTSVSGAVICSKSALGKKVIDDINTIYFNDIKNIVYEAMKELFYKDPIFLKNIEERRKKNLILSIKKI